MAARLKRSRADSGPTELSIADLAALDVAGRVRAVATATNDRFRDWCGDLITAVTADRDGIESDDKDGPIVQLPAGYQLTVTSPDVMGRARLARCVDLVRTTSATMYRNSISGWDDRVKRSEMRLRGLRYILVFRPDQEDGDGTVPAGSDDSIVAFMLLDPLLAGKAMSSDGPRPGSRVASVFVNELHVDPDHQGRRIGSALLGLACRIAGRIRFGQLGLCVFDANGRARKLYERAGFRVEDGALSVEWIDHELRRVRADWAIERAHVIKRGRYSADMDDEKITADIAAYFGRTVDEPGLYRIMVRPVELSAAAARPSVAVAGLLGRGRPTSL